MGTRYAIEPIAPVEEAMTRIPAGVITFGLEDRQLNPSVVGEFYRGRPEESQVQQLSERRGPEADGGPSIHVFGTENGLEYLRFDCFEGGPHYHYVHPHEDFMVIHEMDTTAIGDPFAWSTGRLRERLAPMLVESGGGDLVAVLDPVVVSAALDHLERLHEEMAPSTR
jgi:hypothetical protein